MLYWCREEDLNGEREKPGSGRIKGTSWPYQPTYWSWLPLIVYQPPRESLPTTWISLRSHSPIRATASPKTTALLGIFVCLKILLCVAASALMWKHSTYFSQYCIFITLIKRSYAWNRLLFITVFNALPIHLIPSYRLFPSPYFCTNALIWECSALIFDPLSFMDLMPIYHDYMVLYGWKQPVYVTHISIIHALKNPLFSLLWRQVLTLHLCQNGNPSYLLLRGLLSSHPGIIRVAMTTSPPSRTTMVPQPPTPPSTTLTGPCPTALTVHLPSTAPSRSTIAAFHRATLFPSQWACHRVKQRAASPTWRTRVTAAPSVWMVKRPVWKHWTMNPQWTVSTRGHCLVWTETTRASITTTITSQLIQVGVHTEILKGTTVTWLHMRVLDIGKVDEVDIKKVV